MICIYACCRTKSPAQENTHACPRGIALERAIPARGIASIFASLVFFTCLTQREKDDQNLLFVKACSY